jgi:hypothetical protein
LKINKKKKIYCFTSNPAKCRMIGIIKDVKYKFLNYMFRNLTLTYKEKYEINNELFFTSIRAYNKVFTPRNILIEYPDLILNEEHRTENLGLQFINKTRDIWIDFLKENNLNLHEEAHYDNLL